MNKLKATPLKSIYFANHFVFHEMFYSIRFWWSLMVGVDWWDAVGCTQSAAEDGIGKYVKGYIGIV